MTETKRTILLIDDEISVHQHLPKLMGERFKFYHARTAEAAMTRIDEYPIDVVLLDIELDADRPREGLRVLPQLKEKLGRTPIIVFTKFNDYNNVVEAMKFGAVDFFYKDEQDAVKWAREIEDAIQQSHRSSASSSTQETSSSVTQEGDGFLGKSEHVQKIKKILLKLSTKPNVSVLLTGETGVGKEIAAKYLYQHGVRKDKPFRTVHLSAITETVMESVLFGHKKGAFTDASKDRQGVFQEANGGILFLDEIGEINADIQTKLLRFLETDRKSVV